MSQPSKFVHPVTREQSMYGDPEPGINLREYAAIHALSRIPYRADLSYEATARTAVKMADALLAELAK